jgi:putative hydrolase of the HAD superfamily
VVLWDFEGTLGQGPSGGSWSQSLIDVAREHAPNLSLTLADAHASRGRFPWHQPAVTHPELNEPEAWWAHVGAVVENLYVSHGADRALACHLADRVRAMTTDPAGYREAPTALEALRRMRAAGWHNVVLSNHLPELPAIIHGLSFAAEIDVVWSSANIGAEKPHPEAFAVALAHYGNDATIWMVGDNPTADIQGARQAGIRGVLVGGTDESEALGLLDATDLILND